MIDPGKPTTVSGTPRLLAERLEEAERLMARRRWSKAREILDALDERYPDRADVLSMLLDVCYEQKDMARYQVVCEQLLAQNPDDPDMTLALAGAYISNAYLVLALQTFQGFLVRWPEHASASEARKSVERLEVDLRESAREVDRPWDELLDALGAHDRLQVKMRNGQYEAAIRQGEELIARHLWFTPALNNLSAMYWEQGQRERAMASARQVLEVEPQNVHALSNLVRFNVLNGQFEQARQYAQQLKASKADAFDRSVKMAEALSYLGDDQGVLDAFQSADRESELSMPSAGFLYHLAAVAAYRLGKTNDAERYWRRALKLQPGLELATSNLEDLRKPVSERHAPWPFTFGYYIKREVLDDLIKGVSAKPEKVTQKTTGKEVDAAEVTRQWFKNHPEITALAPLLLERGDPLGREFIFRMANILETPEMLQALKDFALGRYGPDMMRVQAAQKCVQAGLLPSGMLTLWARGQPQDVILMGFEITGEPKDSHNRKVEKLLMEGIEALRQDNGVEAEKLFRQALELEPDAPDLLNNLGAALERQGRQDESQAMLRDVYTRYPDYFFGQTGMALLHIRQGEYAQAHQILERLCTREQLHIMEFEALSATYIELFLAEDNKAAARSWLEMWAQVDPEHPRLPFYRMRTGLTKKPPRWKKGLKR